MADQYRVGRNGDDSAVLYRNGVSIARFGDAAVADALVADLNDVDRLRRHVDDLQSGMFINCVYCGHRYGPGETTPVSMADALKAHVEQCPEHPMSALRKRADAVAEASQAMTNDLRRHGVRQPIQDTNLLRLAVRARAVLAAYWELTGEKSRG